MKLMELVGNHLHHFIQHSAEGRKHDYIKFSDLKLNPKLDNFLLSAEETVKKLHSLEGSPQEVIGNFDVSHNVIIDLKGSPSFVGKNFNCSFNELETLEGNLKEVHGDFNCSDNYLINLLGGPMVVLGTKYDCSNNMMTSLEGAPKELPHAEFICSSNEITELKGCPNKIHGDFRLDSNKLSELFSPDALGIECMANVNVRDNSITTLKNCHRTFMFIGEMLFLKGNPIQECVLSVLLIRGLTAVSMDNVEVQKILNKQLSNIKSNKISVKEAVESAQNELLDLDLDEYARDAEDLLRQLR